MNQTIVLQSHRQPLPYSWLVRCINSVISWSELNKFDYRFIDDELFDYVPAELLKKTETQRVIAIDLARLKALQLFLAQGYKCVIWCDADFLVFAPNKFSLPNENYAVGREVWVQTDDKNAQKLTAHIKVHNAFLLFRQGNSFLDFYADTAEKLLRLNQGPMPPQFIGPKLLSAIHNVVQCPVQETAGMLSPPVIQDIANNDGPALRLFMQRSPQAITAANLCSSLYAQNKVSAQQMDQCITTLLHRSSL